MWVLPGSYSSWKFHKIFRSWISSVSLLTLQPKPAARTLLPGGVLQHRDKTKRSANLQLKQLLLNPKVSSNLLSQVLLQLMLTRRLVLHTLPITGSKEEITSRKKDKINNILKNPTQQHREINSALVCASTAPWVTTGKRWSPFSQHWAGQFRSSTGTQSQSSFCKLQIK